MASLSVDTAGRARIGQLLLACVADHGSATHPYFGSDDLLSGAEAVRNLSDAIHLLCGLHGRHPGIVDLAATRTVEPGAREWLAAAGDAFAAERVHLSRLAAAAGPIPSTPGGGQSQAAILAQRAALLTLSQSDRRGCALGAALAFAIDWAAVRTVLNAAARRLGIDPAPCRLGGPDELAAVAEHAADAIGSERAILFGAQQLALQHRGLWDLLEARQQARRGA